MCDLFIRFGVFYVLRIKSFFFISNIFFILFVFSVFFGIEFWQLVEYIKLVYRNKLNFISYFVKMLSLFIYYELFINIRIRL